MYFQTICNAKDDKVGSAFRPKTQIDVLFNYPDWYGPDFMIGTNDKALRGKKIAIIGGGSAGLMAAFLLQNIGAEVSIYEATNRIGGRACSVTFGDDPSIFELGCMRFPPSSTTLFSLLNHFSIKRNKDFPDPGIADVYTQLYYRDLLIDWPGPGKNKPKKRTLPKNDQFQRIGKQFAAMMDYVLGCAHDPLQNKYQGKLFYNWYLYQFNPSKETKKAVVAAWQSIIDKYENMSFWDAIYSLSQNPEAVHVEGKTYSIWDQSDMNAFGALGVGSGGFGPLFDIGFVEFLRIIANGLEDDQEFLPGGIISLISKMEKVLEDRGANIYLDSPCRITDNLTRELIERPKNRREVFFCPDETNKILAFGVNRKKDISYDGLIIATTNPAMQMMGLGNTLNNTPISNLQPSVKQAIQSLHMLSSSKFFIRTKTKFWKGLDPKGQKIPSNIQSDELFRGLYCLDYDSSSKSGGVVLISYTWEGDSIKLQGLNRVQRYNAFLDVLKKINPYFAQKLRDETIDYGDPDVYEDFDLTRTNMIDWQSQPYYFGAFKLNLPGQDQLCHDAIFQYKNVRQSENAAPYAICGDSISWIGGWIEGALTSAVNAACGIAKDLGAELKKNSPMDNSWTGIPENMYQYGKAPKPIIDTHENKTNPNKENVKTKPFSGKHKGK